MSKIIPEEKAKQARMGRPVLIVLVCGILLAVVAWAGVEIWGERIDAPAIEESGQISQ
ncbi:MAG TPA: hypothetical protein VM510_14375 [Caulifigura sp.]|nr:hypothetical protein [Caulifigura sp.]